MSEPFGTISYQGPGVFIAGGAGITPFLAMLRDLARRGELDRQTLIFSNKAPRDVICEKELRHLLGERCILTCTGVEPHRGMSTGASTALSSKRTSATSINGSMSAARPPSWRRSTLP